MRSLTLLSFRLALAGLVAVSALVARAAESAVKFRPLTLEAASAAAAKEDKLVFIDFYTTWCAPCKQLDADTWTDAGVGRLVNEKAVPLKLDAEKEGRAAAQRYKIEAYPTLLLLKPDGTEVDRIVGYRPPAVFHTEFADGAQGNNALKRAREQAERAMAANEAAGKDAEVKARYDLARELARRGEHAEALRELLWLFDTGMKEVRSYSGVRTSFLTGELGRLATKYAPAREAVALRRDDAKARMLASAADRTAPQEFSALSEALGDSRALLKVFDEIPAGDPRRRGFGLRVYRDLAVTRRYGEAMEVQPYLTMLNLFNSSINPPATVSGPARDSLRKHAIDSAVTNIEVLAGAGDLGHARELRDQVLAVDGSAETKAKLRNALTIAGHPELAPE